MGTPDYYRARALIVDRVGGYLRNADRRAGVVCTVCTEPVEGGSPFCWRCRDDRTAFGSELADLVVPVAYGGHNSQSTTLLFRYKELLAVHDERRQLVALLLWAANALHRRCIELTVGAPIGSWTVVPSTSGRRDHPLPALAHAAGLGQAQILTAHRADYNGRPRATARDRFTFEHATRIENQHVLIVDDTWTTGGRAQSLALSARAAGAEFVSVLVLARWLVPDRWPPAARYLEAHPHRDFDPDICPVTGSACPSTAVVGHLPPPR